MMSLRHFTLRTKSIILAIAAGLALVLVSWVALVALQGVTDEFERFAEVEFAAQKNLADLRLHLGDVRRYEKDTLLNIDDSSSAVSYHKKWRQALGDAYSAIERLNEEGQQSRTAPLRHLLADYERLAAPVLQDHSTVAS